MKPIRQRIERIILVHLLTGDKTFDELLAHVREITQQGREIHRHFEDAMMSLWIDNQIVEVQPRIYAKASVIRREA